MHNKEIKIYNIAATAAIPEEVRRWLDDLGAEDYQDHLQASDAEQVIGLSAKRCYMSFQVGLNPNITKVRRGWTEYFDNVLGSGHGSVFEHASRSYAIEGVSRVFTAEMNRHRAGVAISEGSMRFIRFDDIPFWMPLSLRGPDTDILEETEWDDTAERIANGDETVTIPPNLRLAEKQHITREMFKYAFTVDQNIYKFLVKLWGMDDPDKKFPEKKQITSCLRRIIGIGVSTGGVWTLNLRAIRHILALRSTVHAEEEIAMVASLMAKDIVDKEPNLMGDFEQDEKGFWVPKYAKV